MHRLLFFLACGLKLRVAGYIFIFDAFSQAELSSPYPAEEPQL